MGTIAARFRSTPPAVLLVAVIALCYGGALFGPFQFDDYGIVNDAATHSAGAWFGLLGQGLRPLLKLSYMLSWQIGAGTVGFHVVNVAIHALNALLVLALALSLLDPHNRRDRARTAGSVLCAALFAVHPAHVEAVTYISGRSSSLMTLWCLCALLSYTHGVRTSTPALWAGVAPLLWVCAVLTKETAITLPLAVAAWEVLVNRPLHIRHLLLRCTVWLVLTCGVLVAALLHPGVFALLYNTAGSRPFGDALLYQIHGIAWVSTRLLPLATHSIDPGLGIVLPSRAEVVGGGAVVLGAMALLMWCAAGRRRVAAFGCTWFLLHLLLPYLLLPRDDVLNEHHLYLANVGLFVGLGAYVASLWGSGLRAHIVSWTMIALVAVLAIQTIVRNRDFRSEIALWESTTKASPESPRAFNNLGVIYERHRRLDDACKAYGQAVSLLPGYEAARENLARVQVKRVQVD